MKKIFTDRQTNSRHFIIYPQGTNRTSEYPSINGVQSIVFSEQNSPENLKSRKDIFWQQLFPPTNYSLYLNTLPPQEREKYGFGHYAVDPNALTPYKGMVLTRSNASQIKNKFTPIIQNCSTDDNYLFYVVVDIFDIVSIGMYANICTFLQQVCDGNPNLNCEIIICFIDNKTTISQQLSPQMIENKAKAYLETIAYYYLLVSHAKAGFPVYLFYNKFQKNTSEQNLYTFIRQNINLYSNGDITDVGFPITSDRPNIFFNGTFKLLEFSLENLFELFALWFHEDLICDFIEKNSIKESYLEDKLRIKLQEIRFKIKQCLEYYLKPPSSFSTDLLSNLSYKEIILEGKPVTEGSLRYLYRLFIYDISQKYKIGEETENEYLAIIKSMIVGEASLINYEYVKLKNLFLEIDMENKLLQLFKNIYSDVHDEQLLYTHIKSQIQYWLDQENLLKVVYVEKEISEYNPQFHVYVPFLNDVQREHLQEEIRGYLRFKGVMYTLPCFIHSADTNDLLYRYSLYNLSLRQIAETQGDFEIVKEAIKAILEKVYRQFPKDLTGKFAIIGDSTSTLQSSIVFSSLEVLRLLFGDPQVFGNNHLLNVCSVVEYLLSL